MIGIEQPYTLDSTAKGDRTMTAALAATDQLGMLPHLVEHYSTVEQPASYVVEGALDTEVRVTFTYAVGTAVKTVVGVGKTVDEAAQDVRAKLVAQPEPEPEPETGVKDKGKKAPTITRSNKGA